MLFDMNCSVCKDMNFSCYFLLFAVALMPEGDHLNIIDPPGLTVMRIAGGRYRVTGAVSCIHCFVFVFLYYQLT